MSNYRRLISYIYAYEGGVKGKNVGFAKLETRNGQCRIHVSVRRIYVGSQDTGVYLLSGSSELLIGKIFLRNGAGEFRAMVPVNHVAGTDQTIDQCYGLTIHSTDDSWQSYTTIWEDAVAHAAEVELGEAVSELVEEQEMKQLPASSITQRQLEEAVANHRSSIVETIEAEIQAQESLRENDEAGAQMQAEEQQGENHLRLPNTGSNGSMQQINEPEQEDALPTTVVQPRKTENQRLVWPREQEILLAPIATQPQVTQTQNVNQPPTTQHQELGQSQAVQQQEAARLQAAQAQEMNQPQAPQVQSEYSQENASQAQGAQQFQSAQQFQGTQQPASWEEQQQKRLDMLEAEEPGEDVELGKLWNYFNRTYPKIQAFDYSGGCEILTIKPQDIGLLPREVWTYGNNSFLLHGYYNHRYLILARLNTPNGAPRFLLGVPGHYYSNEKYMASMFGFPNFVLSKMQPSGDGRFGYWYTDIRLGS